MHWEIDMSHSYIGFSVRHMMISRVRGQFKSASASLELDPSSALHEASLKVEVDTKSIDTGLDQRDEHLRTKDFLNTDDYPQMTFESTKVEGSFEDLKINGNLTLLGVTKEVTLTGSLSGPVTDPWGGQRLGVSLTGTLNREEFGLTWNQPMETGGTMLGKDVQLNVEAQVVQK